MSTNNYEILYCKIEYVLQKIKNILLELIAEID
jgi:hypothetical protein